MPRPPFFPLKAAWIKASERGGREGGPKSGPLRPMLVVCNVPICVGKVGRSQARSSVGWISKTPSTGYLFP